MSSSKKKRGEKGNPFCVTHIYFSQIVRPHCALIVVDVQNDFISGSLAIDEVRNISEKIFLRSLLNLDLFSGWPSRGAYQPTCGHCSFCSALVYYFLKEDIPVVNNFRDNILLFNAIWNLSPGTNWTGTPPTTFHNMHNMQIYKICKWCKICKYAKYANAEKFPNM